MKIGNLNAMKHGAFSQMIIISGEDRNQFRALHKALREEWDPQGPAQDDKVFNIAQNLWRKRRLNKFHWNCARTLGDQVLWREDTQIHSLAKFLDDVRAGKPKSELKLPEACATVLRKYHPRKGKESEDDWVQRLASVVVELRENSIKERGGAADEAVISWLCDENVITRELEFEERIDAKIDKDIVALGRMKTMQQMGLGRRRDGQAIKDESMKQVDSPSIDAEESPDKVDSLEIIDENGGGPVRLRRRQRSKKSK